MYESATAFTMTVECETRIALEANKSDISALNEDLLSAKLGASQRQGSRAKRTVTKDTLKLLDIKKSL